MKSYLVAAVLFAATFVVGALALNTRQHEKPSEVPLREVSQIPQQISASVVENPSSVPTNQKPSLVLTKDPVQLPQVGSKQKTSAHRTVPNKVAPPPTPKIEHNIVADIQHKLILENNSVAVVAIKGRLLNAWGTDEETVKIRVLDREDAHLGNIQAACSTLENKDSTFSVTCRFNRDIYCQIAAFKADKTGASASYRCTASDLKLLRADAKVIGKDDLDNITLEIDTLIENPKDDDYYLRQDLTVQAVDADGFGIACFDMSRFVWKPNGDSYIDESARVTISIHSKQKVIFKNKILEPAIYRKIAGWRLVASQMGTLHSFLQR